MHGYSLPVCAVAKICMEYFFIATSPYVEPPGGEDAADGQDHPIIGALRAASQFLPRPAPVQVGW